jgi:Family of unknown function (DUF6152)
MVAVTRLDFWVYTHGAMTRRLFAFCVSGLFISLPLLAHHAFVAAYDMSKPITIHGVITKVQLENPHSWFYLDVKDQEGKTETWAFEAGTPSGMLRNGYKPGAVKPGVEVTIKGFRARDVTKTRGMLQTLTTADGQTFGMFGPQETK